MSEKRTYLITPVAKPRMTRADKWKQRPKVLKYRAFCDEVRLNKVELPESGASITFHLPMPKSWSKKKRSEMLSKPHQQVPDLDNLLKALSDAVYSDDCRIWHYKDLKKLWSENGYIEIEF
jgi:Holliday junction resolvase RusA-like endonuclease